MMKFDDSVNLTRGPWWLWGIGIGIVNMVVTVILEIMKLAMDMDAVMDIVGLVFCSFCLDGFGSMGRKIEKSWLYRTCRICTKNYTRPLGIS